MITIIDNKIKKYEDKKSRLETSWHILAPVEKLILHAKILALKEVKKDIVKFLKSLD